MSIDRIINEMMQVKAESDQLSQMIALAAKDLQLQSAGIQALTRGSRTGENAAAQVLLASRSLSDTAVCLMALNRDIDNVIREVSQ
jgi:hypothetical protein